MANFAPIYNPIVPFQAAIPGGISDGKMVTIQGQVHSHAKTFAVNFVCFNNDIAFHFNPRFNEGPVIVCNTLQGKSWGTEERMKHMPFQRNTYFEIVILVLGQGFKVSVNGQHVLEYRHRVSYQGIQTLQVNGDVSLNCISFSGQSAQTLPAPPPYSITPNFVTHSFASPGLGATMPKKGPMTVHNPMIPFQAAFQSNFTKDHSIVIVGNVAYGAIRFHVNLLNSTSRNIYLHINPRFNEGVLVRNTQEGGKWGTEERHGSYMPLSPGQPFTMTIKNEGGIFGVYINGPKVFDYVHRLPAKQIDMIEVAGDVSITSIQY
ncbi:galectin-4-like [Rhinophrynus dorsalis]